MNVVTILVFASVVQLKWAIIHSVCFSRLYLKAFPDCLQQVGHQGVVPQVGEPNPRAFHIHGTGQEETGACRDKRVQMMSIC